MSTYLLVTFTIITAERWTQDRSLPAAGQPKAFKRNTHSRTAMEENCSRPQPSISTPESSHLLRPLAGTGLHQRALPLYSHHSPPALLSSRVWPPHPQTPGACSPPAVGVCLCTPSSPAPPHPRDGPEDVRVRGVTQASLAFRS